MYVASGGISQKQGRSAIDNTAPRGSRGGSRLAFPTPCLILGERPGSRVARSHEVPRGVIRM